MVHTLLSKAVERWCPRVLDVREDGRDCWRVVCPTDELRVRIFALDRDPRAWNESEIGLGEEIEREKADLMLWLWLDTGRSFGLPFGALRETVLPNWRNWCHIYRNEIMGRLVLMVPRDALVEAMRLAMKRRLGIDLTHCEPAAMRFCRLPCCNQRAFYPCDPEEPLWCWRHWEQVRDVPTVAVDRGDAERAAQAGRPRAVAAKKKALVAISGVSAPAYGAEPVQVRLRLI